MQRPYDQIATRLRPDGTRPQRMEQVCDVLWDALQAIGVSWLGFYVHEGGQELVLAARRDKPACSPIGLHGACGRAYREGRALVVRDVGTLGEHYIACDPRDRSELVVPLFEQDGRCWGVLDLDSHETDAFGHDDVRGLVRVLLAAGLTAPNPQAPQTLVL